MQKLSTDVSASRSPEGKDKLSRRQLFDRGLGIGAFLLTAGAAKAEDGMAGMDMSQPAQVSAHMDMSPTLGMVPEKAAPATDQPLVEPEVRRSVDGVLTRRCGSATPTGRSAACGSTSGPTRAAARGRRCG